MPRELEALYAEMAVLTAPECASACRIPFSCCAPEYCDMAREHAARHGVELEVTGHPRLPYMGDQGCTVPPWLRPLCTLHTCAVNSFGFKPNDPEWTARYFKLRDRIARLEIEE